MCDLLKTKLLFVLQTSLHEHFPSTAAAANWFCEHKKVVLPVGVLVMSTESFKKLNMKNEISENLWIGFEQFGLNCCERELCRSR